MQPTPRQRERERAVISTAVAELLLAAVLIGAALLSASLTLLSELLRLLITMGIQWTTIAALLAVHRQGFRALRFGIGKLEVASNLLGCTGLVVGGLWIGSRVLEVLFGPAEPVAPAGLALAAVAAAALAAVNGYGLVAMTAASDPDESFIYRGQFNARKAKFYASLSVFATITLAALVRDPEVAAALDAVGALLVVFFMLRTGFGLGIPCVRNLLDEQVPPDWEARVRGALAAAGVAPGTAARLRTRRSGRFAQVEVGLPLPAEGLAAFVASAGAVRDAFAREFGGEIDLSIVVRPGS